MDKKKLEVYKYHQIIEEKPYKLLIKLGVPAAIIALLDEINGMIDAIFMGHYFGAEAVASMAVIFPFLILVSAVAFLFAEGSGIAISRYLGGKLVKKANKIMSTTIVVTLLLGVLFGGVGFCLAPVVLDFYDLPFSTYSYALIYIRVFCVALPIVMLSILLAKVLYTEGHVKVMLAVSFLQIGMNVAMNFLLLGVLGLGIIAVSIATVVSMLIQCIILLKHINSSKMAMTIKMVHVDFSKAYFREVVYLGLPTFTSMMLLAITLGLESKIISDFGRDALSVQTITGYVLSATSSVASGIMSAALIIMSYCVGAHSKERFLKVVKLCLITVFGITFIMNLPLIFNSEMVARLFTDSVSLVKKIEIPSKIYGITAPFIFTTNVILYAMQPVGMEKLSTIIFFTQQIILFLPLLFIFREINFNFAIAAQPTSEVIGGVITLLIMPIFMKKMAVYFDTRLKES